MNDNGSHRYSRLDRHLLRIDLSDFPRLKVRACALACLLAAGEAAAVADLFDLPIESLMQMPVSVASPFRESVQESASSVAVLRPEDWRLRGTNNLFDALEQVPSVVSYDSLGGARMYAIRGYANELSVRGTAVMLDSVPLNGFAYASAAYNLPRVALPLLSRVELIRGPGSALYGSDAFHGALALNTWAPGDGHRALGARAGFPEAAQAHITHAGHRGGLHSSGGVVFNHRADTDRVYHYTDPVTGQRRGSDWHDNENDGSLFLNLEWGDEDTGRWQAGILADRYDASEFPGTGTQFLQPLRAMVSSQSQDYSADRDLMGQDSSFLLGRLEHHRPVAPEYRLDLRLFAWRADQTWILDSTAYPLALTRAADGVVMPCRQSAAEPSPSDPVAPVSPLYCPHTQHQGIEETRAGLHALLRHEPAAGTRWALGAGSDKFDIGAAPVRRVGTAGQRYLDMTAPFAGESRRVDHLLFQGRTGLADFTLAYGLRQDEYTDAGGATSPRLALLWQPPGARWNSKLQYGHAFRAPSAAEQFGSGGGTQQLPGIGLKPETIDTLEWVWQQRQDDHDSELVLFGSRWQDGIVLTSATAGTGRYINTGENRSHGIELSHRHSLGRWRVNGNLARVDSENVTTGQDYIAFPEWIANLTLSRLLTPGWSAALTVRGMTGFAEGDVNGSLVPPPAPDYFRLDLHLQWQRDRLAAAIDLRNLLDRDNVVPSLFNASGGAPDESVSVLAGADYRY